MSTFSDITPPLSLKNQRKASGEPNSYKEVGPARFGVGGGRRWDALANRTGTDSI